jgi:hypothetical protein
VSLSAGTSCTLIRSTQASVPRVDFIDIILIFQSSSFIN